MHKHYQYLWLTNTHISGQENPIRDNAASKSPLSFPPRYSPMVFAEIPTEKQDFDWLQIVHVHPFHEADILHTGKRNKRQQQRIERKNRKRRNSKKRLCSSPIKNIYQLVGNIFFKKQWRRMEQGFAANYLLRIIKFCTRIFYKLNLIGCNFKFNFQDVVED